MNIKSITLLFALSGIITTYSIPRAAAVPTDAPNANDSKVKKLLKVRRFAGFPLVNSVRETN